METESEALRWQILSFFPPGYKAEKLKGEPIARWYVAAAGRAHKFLRPRLNPVANKYFLANILTEARNDYGVNPALAEDLKRLNLEEVVQKCAMEGTVEGIDRDNREYACRFGVAFDYKTGAYATRLRRTSVAERLELWNGVGQVRKGGRVIADAANHSRKVMANYRALLAPENEEIANVYRSYGGTL